MKSLIQFLRVHTLVWLVPIILIPLIAGLIIYLARDQSSIPDSPFIYDV